jgi:hypothetical protein
MMRRDHNLDESRREARLAAERPATGAGIHSKRKRLASGLERSDMNEDAANVLEGVVLKSA